VNRRVRVVGEVLLVCFFLLLLQLGNIQIRQASALRKNQLNNVSKPSPYFQPRGEILSADGKVLTYSKAVADPYHYLRVYPAATAQMFSGITGYYATAVQASPFGIEAYYDSYLRQHETPIRSLHDLLTQHLETDDVVLTASEHLQAVAMQALDSATANNGGAVIALDPRNGDILAMYSAPTYNPNLLAAHDPRTVNQIANDFNSRPSQLNPFFNNAIRALHPPGSTFKVVTTSSIFDHKPSIATQQFPVESTYEFPNSGSPPQLLHNYDSEPCGGDLAEVLAFSCDTSYSQIGDELGSASLAAEAQAFGFNSVPPIDLPGAAASVFPPPSSITASSYLGYSAIGQFDDDATLLQMALLASAIADDGTIMAPHLVSKVVGSDGSDEFVYQPHAWRQATSAATATKVRQLMTGVTTMSGATADQLFQGYYSSGFPTAAAKTGTAEPAANVCGTYNWLIALAPAGPGQTPSVVVAAMVPVLSSVACSINPTGASIAGPVALPVLEAALQQQGAG
jgi:peptidoglycan glycosyltransferase